MLNNNNNNYNNNDFNNNLNSKDISTFKAVNIFKNKFKSMSSDLFKKFNIFKIFTPLQIIIISGIIIVLISYIIIRFIYKLIYDKTLAADLLILKLNSNIPYLAAYVNYDKNSCFYDNYIYEYYNVLIDQYNNNKFINNSINQKSIIRADYFTINFWLIVTDRNSAIVRYFENKMADNLNTNLLNEIFSRDNNNRQRNIFKFRNYFFSFTKDYKLTYSETSTGDGIITNVKPKINKWENITIVIKNTIISIYLNTDLLFTGSINLKNLNSTIMLLGIDKIENDPSAYHGFPGFLNYFSYFSKALEPDDIEHIYEKYIKKINNFYSIVNKNNLKNIKDYKYN